jgi:predicted acetyltransferase
MEKLNLVEPSKDYIDQIQSYLNEFENELESLHGGCGLQEIKDVEAWLVYLERFKHEDTVPEGRVKSSEYMCVREKDNQVVGLINIRHVLNDDLLFVSGHVGYSIRPSERLKGYAHEQLRLALNICDHLGINPILITCNKDNEASRRTILKAHGIKENEVVEEDGNIVERYWIYR